MSKIVLFQTILFSTGSMLKNSFINDNIIGKGMNLIILPPAMSK